MRVSVVLTVLNEADSLPRLFDSLAAQTRPPDEVVVCDGGSTDGTLRLLEAESRLPLRLIRRPGVNISQGRNAAIEAATGAVIAVTDAGVRLSSQWLERIIAPFEDAAPHIVAGFFRPDPQTIFETAMGATVLPELREINPPRFLPSSRSVAFRKSAWAAVGGYPEWLDYCEDLIFDLRLRDLYGPFVFVPEALVHLRPRPSLRAFFVQYYRYARGDGKADLWRKRHAIRYLTYLVAVPFIAIAGALVSPWWWALYLISIPGMFWLPWRRLARMWSGLTPVQKLQAALWMPVIRVTGDVAKMIGYPVGVWWRWRKRSVITARVETQATIELDARHTRVISDALSVTLFAKLQPLYSTRLVLTSPILRKNRHRHPEMDAWYRYLPLICCDPDTVCRNRRMSEIAVCYREVKGRRLRAVVWLKQADSRPEIHNSVLSFRLCHKREWEDEERHGRVVYRRKV